MIFLFNILSNFVMQHRIGFGILTNLFHCFQFLCIHLRSLDLLTYLDFSFTQLVYLFLDLPTYHFLCTSLTMIFGVPSSAIFHMPRLSQYLGPTESYYGFVFVKQIHFNCSWLILMSVF